MTRFKVGFSTSEQTFEVGFKNLQFVEREPDIEKYLGPYEVTPTPNGQVLETAKKYMRDDVTVKSIPFFETSNASGGNTIYIASEV